MNTELGVIGTVSLDVLHLPNGQTVHTIGGAGLYTALAAYRAGVKVGLFAPRPDPMPALLMPVAQRVEWWGPVIAPDDLPRLEIQHHGEGKATLLTASWGAESQLTPDTLPEAIGRTGMIHIAALSSAQRQLDFLNVLKKTACVSVGTYARLVYNDTAHVQELFNQADIFFMNENEANGLFGGASHAQTRAGALLFVTHGEKGALVITEKESVHIPAKSAPEVDPTGAGDTFCGATLAGLIQQKSPLAAAEFAVRLAAETVSAVGPAALLGEAGKTPSFQ